MTPSAARHPLALVTLAIAVALTAAPFFRATTFTGDDHLFLAFARFVANPLDTFVRDHHGGEFYRPIPMTLWWGLARAGAGTAFPFALTALLLHALASLLLATVLVAVHEPRRTAWLAATLFFVFPQTLEAAYWFSASTDLLASAATLAALLALARHRLVSAALLASLAYLSKESALALPLLGLVLLARRDGAPRRAHWLAVAPLFAVAAAFIAARWVVLQGWGGAGDPRAPIGAKLLQLSNGLLHIAPGSNLLPEPVAWLAGVVLLALPLLAAARFSVAPRATAAAARFSTAAPSGDDLRSSRRGSTILPPVVFTAVSMLPLLGADWAVGARYFYLPATGFAWLIAQWLAQRSPATTALAIATLLGLGTVQGLLRQREVLAYQALVVAARRAVRDGVARGHTTFHIAAGIKDIDLVVKADPHLAPLSSRLLILGDVPASFVIVPSALEAATRSLSATPPIPPSGAYHFGTHRIVGLPRRGDEPALRDVVQLLPGIRFIRLRGGATAQPQLVDVTDQIKRSLN